MAVGFSTGFRDSIMNGQFNTGAGADFDSGVLEIRSGPKPSSPDDAPEGTLLVSITIPADGFGASSAGVVAKAGTWEDTSADAAGTAGHYRLKTSGDGGGSSTTDRRIDGTVTATGGGGDLTLDNTSIAEAQSVTINTFTYTQPAGG